MLKILFYVTNQFFICFTGPVASVFVNKYGCRVVTIAGAILASICLFISIFANSLVFLYFSIGIGTGTLQHYIIINIYFFELLK